MRGSKFEPGGVGSEPIARAATAMRSRLPVLLTESHHVVLTKAVGMTFARAVLVFFCVCIAHHSAHTHPHTPTPHAGLPSRRCQRNEAQSVICCYVFKQAAVLINMP